MEEVLNSKFVYKNDFVIFDVDKENYKSYENVAKKSNGQLVFTSPE